MAPAAAPAPLPVERIVGTGSATQGRSVPRPFSYAFNKGPASPQNTSVEIAVDAPPGLAPAGFGGETSRLGTLIPNVVAPPPPRPQVDAPKPPSAPLRVGGDVQMAMLLRKVIPEYPNLARSARISGVVHLIGTIGKDGKIQNLQLVSGHPLLARAALEAVRQWVYKPTLLNGNPVEVIAPIDVNFTLGP